VSANGEEFLDLTKQLLARVALTLDAVLGIVSDGGSNIVGEGIGMLGLAEKELGRPLLAIPDLPHKLQNAVGCLKEDPGFASLEKLFRKLDGMYHASGRLWREMLSIAAKAGKKALRPAKGYRIRWLPKWESTYKRAEEMWDLWVEHLGWPKWSSKKKCAPKKRQKMRAMLQSDATAKTFRVIRGIIEQLKVVSLAMQETNISCMHAEAALAQAVAGLRGLAPSDIGTTLIDKLRQLHKDTFQTGVLGDIMVLLDVFSIKASVDADYGVLAFQALAKIAGVSPEDTQQAEGRWTWVKEVIRGYNVSELSFDVWTEVLLKLQRNDDTASQSCSRVLQLILTAGCWSSCVIERDFSRFVNRVGTKRTRLTVWGLDEEDFVECHGPSPHDLEAVRGFLKRGVRIWYAKKRRRKGGATGGRRRKHKVSHQDRITRELQSGLAWEASDAEESAADSETGSGCSTSSSSASSMSSLSSCSKDDPESDPSSSDEGGDEPPAKLSRKK
jgi:hypothetical protein